CGRRAVKQRGKCPEDGVGASRGVLRGRGRGGGCVRSMVATQNVDRGRRRHVPMRRCVVCRESKPQAELLRLTHDAEGRWVYDARRRLRGRGTWVCRSRAAAAAPGEDGETPGRACKAEAAAALAL